jgi:hypothetical protein
MATRTFIGSTYSWSTLLAVGLANSSPGQHYLLLLQPIAALVNIICIDSFKSSQP